MARKLNTKRISLTSAINAAALAVACGSEQESPPPADDAGLSSCTGGSSDTGGSSTGGSSTGGSSTGGWAGSAGSGAAACNTLANLSDVVHHMADPAPIPEMTGGPIANGTYVLTSLVHYDGASADPTSTVKHTLLVTENGATVQEVLSIDGLPELRRTYRQAPASNELNAGEICPEQLTPVPLPYTATPTSLAILLPAPDENLVITLTRPDCVGPAENHFCAPEGFPFVKRAFAVTETCPGEDCHPPNPTLTQPEPGTLCMSGTVPEGGWHAIRASFFAQNQDGSELVSAFDADALGITQVSFTIDSPPASGLMVDITNMLPRGCTGPIFDCLAFGFTLPPITEPGTTTAALVDFLQVDPLSPNQTIDTSSLGGIAFAVEAGAYDFCVRDFKFLDEAGDEVTP